MTPSIEKRYWDLNCEIVYGPISSRRFGLSLGINLLPSGLKVCDFDCLYCQCGWTFRRLVESSFAGVPFPSLIEIERAVTARFGDIARSSYTPDVIMFSGNGEPTLHPQFREAVEIVAQARNSFLPESRLGLLTNGSHLFNRTIFEALPLIELKSVKFDAGREWLDRPLVAQSLMTLLQVWGELPDLTIQSFFCEGQFANTGAGPIQSWLGHLVIVRPIRLQLYTLDRVPPVSTMTKASLETLESIAEQARQAMTQCKVEVFA
jgi:wyosine [tRNA(Phe)-imidazoG37] synthetase (radical SAM superfamily)